MESYNIPAPLLQHVINLLGEMPARISRQALNELEKVVAGQEATKEAPRVDDAP